MVALGKNDFWGFPGILLWHTSFDHFTPGQLRLSIPAAGNTTHRSFDGSQKLSNGLLAGSVGYITGYALGLSDLFVAAGRTKPWPNPNVATGMLQATCPAGVSTVEIELSIAPGGAGPDGDNVYGLPVSTGTSPDSVWLIKENTKSKILPPLMLPCSTSQIIYNSQRHFSLAADGTLAAFNVSGTSEAPGRQLCLRAAKGQRVVSTVLCDEAADDWVLHSDKRIVSKRDSGICLSVNYTGSTECAGASKDPASAPPCMSNAFQVLSVPCAEAYSQWNFTTTQPSHAAGLKVGFLSVSGSWPSVYPDQSDNSVCLSAVPPPFSNDVATVVSVPGALASVQHSTADQAKLTITVPCGNYTRINVAMATQRDAARYPPHDATQQAALSLATDLASAASTSTRAADQMLIATTAWWNEWWSKSSVELGRANELLQRWYYTMLYLLRGSVRTDSVAPALWGDLLTRCALARGLPVQDLGV